MQYTFEDIEINTATQEIARAGEVVHTEPQVFSVIEYLVDHRDRVVTKIELLDEIWGSRFVSESALTSRIKTARQVCGDNGRDQAVIRTVHGTGYRFVADVTSSDGAPPRVFPAQRAATGGLIGRRREVDEVEAALERAATGRRSAVFVTGPAGIGKTTFLAEVGERIDDRDDWQLLRGQSLPRTAVEPYFPILDALSRAARSGNDAIATALDRVAPMWLAQLPSLVTPDSAEHLGRRLLGTNPDRMLREGAEVLEELAAGGPVALVLEDLHWADRCTLDLLDLALQRTEPCRLAILASVRSEPSPTLELVRARTGAGHAAHVELRGFGPDELDQLVTDALDGAEVPAAVLDIVRRRSNGIPLFALEIVRGWRQHGHLVVDEGAIALTLPADELDSLLPDNLRQLIEHDIARLDERTTAVLEIAALVGADFEAASVAAALAEPIEQVDAELTEMARRLHQITAVGGAQWPDGTASTRFRFGHDLFRQVLHDRLPINRSVKAHAAIGLALENGFSGRTDEIAGRLAEQFLASGDDRRAVEYLRLVGERSVRGSAFGAATTALLTALDHLARIAPDPERDQAELKVRLALGPALVATRGWYGAETAENYERALELCATSAPCPESAVARLGLATVTELRGEYERTEQLLTPLLPDVSGMSTEAKELMACSTFHQGKFATSLDLATNVLKGWDGTEASEALSRLAEHPVSACYSWASLATWALGRLDEALTLAEQAIAAGEEHLYALSTAEVQRAFLHQLRREPDECRRWAESAQALARQQGFPMRAVQAELMLGWADAVSGDPVGADRIREALAAFRATGARLSEPYFLGLIAEAELLHGRCEDAVDIALDAIDKMTRGSRTFFAGPELHRIAARALAACGRDAEAREHADAALRLARELGSPVLELRALVDALQWFGPDQALRSRLVELTDQIDTTEGPDLADAHAVLAKTA